MITSLKERGLSMSTAMVKSYMAGLKGMTRRLVNPQPPEGATLDAIITFNRVPTAWGWDCQPCIKCPYGTVGHTIYFREHWRAPKGWDTIKPSDMPEDLTPLRYEADEKWTSDKGFEAGKFRQGRFMCRWMSRFRHIPITGIRVERLGDISEQDAMDEGVTGRREGSDLDAYWISAREVYRELWSTIHGPGSWERDKNLFVWVLEFPKYKP